MDTRSLPFIPSPSPCKQHVTNRFLWGSAFVVAAGIIPVSIATGLKKTVSEGWRAGLKTMGYGSAVGLYCMWVTGWSATITPAYGKHETHIKLIDVDDLKKHPTDGFSKLDPEKYDIRKPIIRTNKGKIDVTEISPKNVQSDCYMFAFPGAGHVVEHPDSVQSLADLATKLKCTILAPNYPGATTASEYKLSSSDDCTNIGIALVNYMMSAKSMSLTQVAQCTVIMGYSKGGMVALNMAYHLQTEYAASFPVITYLSPRDLNRSAANNYTRKAGLPEGYMTAFQYPVFKAADFNFRTGKLYSALNPDLVLFINAIDDPAIPRGFGHADEPAGDPSGRYYTWKPSTPEEKLTRTPHQARLKDLIQSDNASKNAFDTVGLFARRMWTRRQVESKEQIRVDMSLGKTKTA